MLSKPWYMTEPAIPYDPTIVATKDELRILTHFIRKTIPGCRFTKKQTKELLPLLGNLLHCYRLGVNLEYAMTRSLKSRRTLRDKLVQCNLVMFQAGACFGTSAYYTSKIKPLPLLWELFHWLIVVNEIDPKTGKNIKTPGDDPTMRDRIYRHNDAMAGHVVTDGNGNRLATDLYRCHKIIVGREYKGRFQQSSYQQLPKSARDLIQIDGESVARIDVAGAHPQILYHLAKKQMPANAPYGILPQHPELKEVAKLAMLMMLNASSRKGAITALQNKLASRIEDYAAEITLMQQRGIKLSHIMDALEKLNSPIAKHFYTQPCHRLMEIEANIIFQTIELLVIGRGVGAVSVYDEIIVPAAYKKQAKQVLEVVWKKELGFTPRT